jgi:hypothetical protein
MKPSVSPPGAAGGRFHCEVRGPWLGTVPIGNLWHTGIVVADLDAAIQDFRLRSDVEFVEPILVPLTIRDHTTSRLQSLTVRTAMSMGTPPYLELIEAIPETVYAVGQVHLGFWCDDLKSAGASMIADGYAQIMSDANGEGGIAEMMSYHATPGGYIVEVVAPYLKPLVKSHQAGGPPPVPQHHA